MAALQTLILYTIREALQQSDPNEEVITAVFDMTSFSIAALDIEGLHFLIDALKANFPDILGQALVVNAPFVFWATWSMIKHILDPDTVAKLKFIDESQVKDFLTTPHPDIGGTT